MQMFFFLLYTSNWSRASVLHIWMEQVIRPVLSGPRNLNMLEQKVPDSVIRTSSETTELLHTF